MGQTVKQWFSRFAFYSIGFTIFSSLKNDIIPSVSDVASGVVAGILFATVFTLWRKSREKPSGSQ